VTKSRIHESTIENGEEGTVKNEEQWRDQLSRRSLSQVEERTAGPVTSSEVR
jgi:hypothetical protein